MVAWKCGVLPKFRFSRAWSKSSTDGLAFDLKSVISWVGKQGTENSQEQTSQRSSTFWALNFWTSNQKHFFILCFFFNWSVIYIYWNSSFVYSSAGGTSGNESTCNEETQVQSLGQEDPLGEGMATHSSILIRRNPWTEEPGRLQFMRLQRVGHDWSDWVCMHACTYYKQISKI